MGKTVLLPHNLPHPLTKFIGRGAEIAKVCELLSETRLLTLTGMGGSGKTRLAIQIAYELLEDYPDGIWLVELGEISDPAFVPQTIATTLGLHKEPGLPLIETIVSFLEPKRLLVVLDNCEHLIEICARSSQTILSSCPQVQILATSRESIQIPGESSWQVLPLSLPSTYDLYSLQDIIQSEAIQLFIDRARSISPAVSLTMQNASEIVQLCRRLEGIPLAIELAAAWVNVLSVDQINERLDHSLQLLVRSSRLVPVRQQTLRATLDWSYDLLSEKEQMLFRRLALFNGDFSLSTIEAIGAGNGLEENEVIGLLAQLVSKSLVLTVIDESEGKRYRLLDIVRQYSLEKLRVAEEEASVSFHFLDYYVSISEKAETELAGPQQGKWVTFFEQELSHLRMALKISQEVPGRIEKGLRLAEAMNTFTHIIRNLNKLVRSTANHWLGIFVLVPVLLSPFAGDIDYKSQANNLAFPAPTQCIANLVDTSWIATLPTEDRTEAYKLTRMELQYEYQIGNTCGANKVNLSLIGPDPVADALPEECTPQYNADGDAWIASQHGFEKHWVLKEISAECFILTATR